MTKDQAVELKRLAYELEHFAHTSVEDHDDARARLHAAIDSLTQQPAELTDAELNAIQKEHCGFFNFDGLQTSRAVIAAHKEKVKV